MTFITCFGTTERDGTRYATRDRGLGAPRRRDASEYGAPLTRERTFLRCREFNTNRTRRFTNENGVTEIVAEILAVVRFSRRAVLAHFALTFAQDRFPPRYTAFAVYGSRAFARTVPPLVSFTGALAGHLARFERLASGPSRNGFLDLEHNLTL